MKLCYILMLLPSFSIFANNLFSQQAERAMSYLKIVQIKELAPNNSNAPNTLDGQFAIFGSQNSITHIALDASTTLKNNAGNELLLSLNADNPLQYTDSRGIAEYTVSGIIQTAQNNFSGTYYGTYNVTISY
jgi:hypothetical protein